MQYDTDVVQEDETEERTDKGHDDNASEIPKRQHVGAGLDGLDASFDRKTCTHKIK